MLLLAPFKGITERPYRNAFARHIGGIDLMYAPFVSGVGTERINPSKLADVIPREKNICPTIPQFISTDAREIILIGKTLKDYGYDHINWNLGCPFSRIANKKRGCGMLPYPGELDRILEEVFREIPINLSIKTRLGYHSPDELFPVLDVFNRYPIHLLILHPRIGTQLYSGEVSLNGFESCLENTAHEVAYNGDIWNATRYQEVKQRFPQVKQWMLGRGLLMNPFLAMEAQGKELSDAGKRAKLMAFHQELFETAQERTTHEGRIIGSLKAIWYYMAGSFSDGRQLFSLIKKTKNTRDYLEAANHVLQQEFAGEGSKAAYFRSGIKHLGVENSP
jgi:tRNA-dihydrouridine synthase B